MNTKPSAGDRLGVLETSTSVVVPPLATAPSDFSRMVVRPPALLPGEGLLSIVGAVGRGVASHQSIRSTQLLGHRAAGRAPREQVLGAVDLRRLGEDRRAALRAPAGPTAAPSAGLAVMPD